MNKTKRILSSVLCMALIAGVSVMGTLAYLTDRDSVANTFTVGNVDIKLDEQEVTPDGKPVDPPVRTEDGNKYHLIPGQTYTKDPTVTVLKDSEESYVRMLVTINCKKELDIIFAPNGANLVDIFKVYDPAIWKYETETADEQENTITYEFRYHKTVGTMGATDDLKLEPLFTTFTLPGEITGEQLKTLKDDPATPAVDESLKITIEGHAIQAATFEAVKDDAGAVTKTAEDVAWEAFDKQHNA